MWLTATSYFTADLRIVDPLIPRQILKKFANPVAQAGVEDEKSGETGLFRHLENRVFYGMPTCQ
jgi:hypothetical protein